MFLSIPHGYYAAAVSWTSSGTKFYNNTIYAPTAVTGSNGVAGVFLESNGYTDIRNNIIVTYQSSIAYTAVIDETGLISDYNLYYNATSGQDFVRITPARYATFAQWQTYGYDTHSLHVASVAAVKFANVAGYPTACQTMDLSIISSKPCGQCRCKRFPDSRATRHCTSVRKEAPGTSGHTNARQRRRQ